MEFCNDVLNQLKKCKNFKCCGSLSDEPCRLECRGKCQCTDCLYYYKELPSSARYFALSTLCWPEEQTDKTKQSFMKYHFDRKCWTGLCKEPHCLKFGSFFTRFEKLFSRGHKFKFWTFQELERESIEGKVPWVYHGFGTPEFFNSKEYKCSMQNLLARYVPHLVALNFGNEQLARITDKQYPRLPVGDALIGIDFSALPHFVHGTMSQHDYQTTQTFGLCSVVAFWVTKTDTLKKAVYEMVFTDPTHSTERICQGLDQGLQELEHDMAADEVQLRNLYLYSDCAAGDQKNKYFICHISELVTTKGDWIPVRYFQRPANHNKFDFDSEGGLFKLKYFL